MKKFLIPIFCLAVLTLSGCVSAKVFVANLPIYFKDLQITRDVVFDTSTQLKLDVYVPAKGKPVHQNVVVFFYGGSWQSGYKEQYGFVGATLAQHGYIVVIPDYRKYPQVKFPSFMFDGAKAVAWTQREVSKYGVQNPNIILMGHSAGANIASLLASDSSYLKGNNIHLSGVIALGGPYDFTPNTPELEAIFGPSENYPSMRPVTFVDGNEPPFFLASGGKDEVVAGVNTDHMNKALKQKGVCVRSLVYPDYHHMDLVGQLSWVSLDKTPLQNDVLAFLSDVENHKVCP